MITDPVAVVLVDDPMQRKTVAVAGSSQLLGQHTETYGTDLCLFSIPQARLTLFKGPTRLSGENAF